MAADDARPAAPELILTATTYPLIALDALPPAAGTRFEEVVADCAARGYRALDIAVVHVLLIGKARFTAALRAHGLRFVAKVYSSGHPGAIPSANPAALAAAEVPHPVQGPSVAEHVGVWAAQVREAATPSLRPYLLGVASHSGRDKFTDAQADEFFAAAVAVAAEVGVPAHHETHRGRLLFNPWTVGATLQRHPALSLLADLSHYCVVAEAPPGDADLEAAIAPVLSRTGHIHARVGFEEGPQIPDPRHPRWRRHVAGHAAWWRAIFTAAARRGAPFITVTPEFLPPPYAWTRVDDADAGDAAAAWPGPAVSDVYSINHFMADLVRKEFAAAMEEAGFRVE
jgi:hypothetical protein